MTAQRRPTTRAALRKSMRLSSSTLSEEISSNNYSSALMKLLALWAVVIVFDMTVEFRAEFLWPLFVYAKNSYDAWKYHGCMFGLTFLLASLFSDFVMCVVIPLRWLAVAAITFLCIQLFKTSALFTIPSSTLTMSPTCSFACVVLLWILMIYLCNHVPCFTDNNWFRWWHFVMVNVLVYPLMAILCAIRNRFRSTYYASGRDWTRTRKHLLLLTAARVLKLISFTRSFFCALNVNRILALYFRRAFLDPPPIKTNNGQDTAEVERIGAGCDRVSPDRHSHAEYGPTFAQIDIERKKVFLNTSVQCDINGMPKLNTKRRMDEVAKLQDNIRKLQNELQRLRSSEGQLRAENNTLQSEVTRCKADKREKDELYNRIKRISCNDQLNKTTITALEQEVKNLQEKLEITKKSLEEQKIKEENALNSNRKLKEQLADISITKEDLSRKLLAKTEQLADTEQLHNDAVSGYELSNSHLRVEIEEILGKNKRLVDEANRLRTELISLEHKVRTEVDRCNKILIEYEQLKQENLHFQYKNRDLQVFNANLISLLRKFVPGGILNSIIGPIAASLSLLEPPESNQLPSPTRPRFAHDNNNGTANGGFSHHGSGTSSVPRGTSDWSRNSPLPISSLSLEQTTLSAIFSTSCSPFGATTIPDQPSPGGGHSSPPYTSLMLNQPSESHIGYDRFTPGTFANCVTSANEAPPGLQPPAVRLPGSLLGRCSVSADEDFDHSWNSSNLAAIQQVDDGLNHPQPANNEDRGGPGGANKAPSFMYGGTEWY